MQCKEACAMQRSDWMVRYMVEPGFLMVPICLLNEKTLPVSAAIVYAAMVYEDSDSDNTVCVKNSKLMRKTGYGMRQVLRAIAALTAAGLLTLDEPRSGRANTYHLTARLLPPKRSSAAADLRNDQHDQVNHKCSDHAE